jgi:hypothetical protein
MLRRLYRCAVRLHPSSFRRRFGDEMLYIFDQQRGTLAALGVTLDCVLSMLRQRMLRPHIGRELATAPLGSPTANHVPSFQTIETFQPRASALIHGTLLSLILLYVSVVAIRYSSIHVSNLRFPQVAVDVTQSVSGDSEKSPEQAHVDVMPTESNDLQSKSIASTGPRASAEPVRTRGVTIWLDRYVGKYICNHPAAKISIQIERDPLRGDHLSLSSSAAIRSSLPLSPLSPRRFVVVGAENAYVDFTADAQGRICCLSLVENGNVIAAQRQ